MTTVGAITEQGLIAHIQEWTAAAAPGTDLELGIGDDAAVFRPVEGRIVATVDILAEGVDFDRSYAPLELVGRKAAAVNLSDLAAMGARPLGLLVAVSVHAQTDVEDLHALFAGLTDRAVAHGACIAGGDLSGPPAGDRGLTVTVTALGSAGEPVRRSGARPGDLVCVTGTLGDSALGLELLQAGRVSAPSPGGGAEDAAGWLARRHLDPEPRVEPARALAPRVRAMIDVSDGFAADLGHLTEAAGLGARVDMEKLPRSEAFRVLAGEDAIRHVLTGGEDFELLCAVDPAELPAAQAAIDVPLTVVGQFTQEPGVQVRAADGRAIDVGAGGWQHFR